MTALAAWSDRRVAIDYAICVAFVDGATERAKWVAKAFAAVLALMDEIGARHGIGGFEVSTTEEEAAYACRSHDARECYKIRYQLESIYDDGRGVCECPCHDALFDADDDDDFDLGEPGGAP